ncbi:unnamed protein product [Pieris macdunnoughi]|uniref:Metalloendopeptidase n=1 Tax=Pieris macdunnoughi TaxID=345717 RepID=A0A821TGA7_9NEOP|nr:unnamed protein product [Pieris macdunnoughi]
MSLVIEASPFSLLSHFSETSVNGAITFLSQLRRENSVTDHKQSVEEIPPDEKEEPGFDLDEREIKKFHIWPKGIIPYYIDDFSFDKVLRDTIRAFLKHTNHMTGLQFLELPSPPKDDSRWVFFINRQGLLECINQSFRSFTNDGVQKVLLGYDCIINYGMLEVLLMLVGVPPQHNSPDRDDYVETKMNNVIPNKKYLFKKFKDDEWLFHDLEYDFKSAGHYDSHKFTVNGRATLIPKDDSKSNLEIGFKKHFSSIDIKKIKMLYNFISKKEPSVHLPQCSKMFNPGSNFSKYRENKITEGKPRNKPNKYLGVPDEAPDREDVNSHFDEVNGQTNENITNPKSVMDNNDDDEEEEVEKPENRETEEVAKDAEQKIEESVDDVLKEDSQKTEERIEASENQDFDKENKTVLKGKTNHKGENLLDLSDFATGEDN